MRQLRLKFILFLYEALFDPYMSYMVKAIIVYCLAFVVCRSEA